MIISPTAVPLYFDRAVTSWAASLITKLSKYPTNKVLKKLCTSDSDCKTTV